MPRCSTRVLRLWTTRSSTVTGRNQMLMEGVPGGKPASMITLGPCPAGGAEVACNCARASAHGARSCCGGLSERGATPPGMMLLGCAAEIAMPEYRAPLDDIRFVLNELAGLPELAAAIPVFENATGDVVDAVVNEAAR